MNCPRCQTPIGKLSDPDSIVTCPGCGSRLMTRSAALRSQGGPKAGAPAVGPGTKPPLPGPAPATPPPATRRAAPPAPPPASPALSDPDLHAFTSAADLPPSATIPPTPAEELGVRRRRSPGAGHGSASLEQVLEEIRAVRALQERVLDLLERAPSSYSPQVAAAAGGPDDSGLSAIRARRRKSVVLIDDDPATREAAILELQQADVPVRAFDDGNAALSGIAADKPDVIVLELGLEGDMAGKDLINMIKATMEWVDVPLVLWTRLPVANQKEARQIHGADEIVPKASGAAALVARIISIFRRS